ncbi:MAG: hypothetical protein P0Y56_00765 [Candidatus Andeanibacterium colombiense]|uniref:Secreted protein n=1 Tax=Candidatus Andeanibacterium colombiense TaxID=3121345 RepID=A0AAJ5X947_9SPHN|nr:MAG: hypothetical protein P0Y56_00765 [Sphingomonadaceae bacterium]
MLKRILTLFAILTGLAAIAAPVEARFISGDDIGLHAAGENASKCADKHIEDGAAPRARYVERKAQAPAACRPAVITIVIPTVMLGSDRSLD